MRILTLNSDEPSQAFTRESALKIYNKMPVVQERSFEDFYSDNTEEIVCNNRLEYILDDGSFLITCIDRDVHVGRCLLVLIAHSFGESLAPVYRDLKRIAKGNDLKWMAYTHHKESIKTSHTWELKYKLIN